MQKIISDYKMFQLHQKGYKGDDSIASMIEYLQNQRMFVKLKALTLTDPEICEKLYRLVLETLK